MDTLFAIKEALPASCSARDFNINEEGKLRQVVVTTEGELTRETMNALVEIFNNNLGSYQLNGNFNNGTLRAQVV